MLISSAFRRILAARTGIESVIVVNKVVQGCAKMTRKSLKVDRSQFEGIVKRLLDAKPLKREDVKVSKKKPEKLIPPHK